MLKTGELLSDRYEVKRILGEGGMGAVYLVADTRIPCSWAVKEMSDSFLDETERQQAVESFRAEADILSALKHPNLPRITDSFSQNGRQYLVMDFIEGETLETRLARSAPLPLDQVIDLALQLTEVLDYLHRRPTPVIFRDFKPANIMLTPQGQVKLIDFGIARLFRNEATLDTRQLGTPGYAAPEQYGRGQSDARTDIYALGATLHQAVTGIDPAQDPFDFPLIRERRPEVPPALELAILKAVSLKKEDRFQTAGQFRAALEELREDPQAYRHLPERLRTGVLPPPRALGFEPPSIRLGPVARGATPRAQVKLRGDFEVKLQPDRRWLQVEPRQVKGSDQMVQIQVSTRSMVDGGRFKGQVRARGKPEVAPLEVEVEVEPSHVSFWSLTLAFLFCLGSTLPLVGYATTFLLGAMFFSTPRGERALLKVFLSIALLCSLGWTLVAGLLGFGLAQVPWERLPVPWVQSGDPSPTPVIPPFRPPEGGTPEATESPRAGKHLPIGNNHDRRRYPRFAGCGVSGLPIVVGGAIFDAQLS